MINQEDCTAPDVTAAWGYADDLRRTLSELLAKAVRDNIIPGGVVMVSQGTEAPLAVTAGSKFPPGFACDTVDMGARNVTLDTVFDLGALTSGICTSTLAMNLVARGKLGIHDRASRYIQAFGLEQRSLITIMHLLSHSTGFPSGISVYNDILRAHAGPRPGIMFSTAAKQFGYKVLHELSPRFEPGTRRLVSDVNAIVCGEICEVVTGLPLDKAFARLIAAPFGMTSTGFIDRTALQQGRITPQFDLFAPAGECPQRDKLILGEAWHEGTWAMGGVSGHSGLFGVVTDVHTWARELLNCYAGRSQMLAPEVVQHFFNPHGSGTPALSPLGFEATSKEGGFIEEKLAPRAVTLSSPTGCSVFLDPESDVAIVFLSNAGWYGGDRRKFTTFQAVVHNSLMGLLR